MTSVMILTISDTRNLSDDKSGQYLVDEFRKNDVSVLDRQVVKDDVVEIQAQFLQFELAEPDLIVTNGGTGIARRDVTIPAIEPLLTTKVTGFGETFRELSYQEIGTHALASRAIAGFNYYHQLCYCLPGSTGACRTAMSNLIIPEYQHLLFERRK
ncbi:MogA/MoaB family molybdenum cofactor biosynthesis protein [Secundilactobacillus folii]|uniref:Molybdenum cofactor biosynthesis protein B n=1 Tax=Secundilactobacillus folii TaxID=2678357 RepID=A0A7X2XW45_9LACO|nr:molybdenum cofactor biosynthesis protein B [Secundilactobacillus folii]MTV82165.1 molybdenum cofactor biosynthesis protein [Secundilactobacillus folii]